MPSLRWSNISLRFKKKRFISNVMDDREILHRVSGEIHSGQLLAILGPTGCGKTSLLNILAGRLPFTKGFSLFGNVYWNGSFAEYPNFNKKAILISQDDSLFSFLTVRETLLLSAYFHFSNLYSKHELSERVDMVIRELGLSEAADSMIGSNIRRGISGGEYKRVLIGKQLIKRPKSIFLDEPTSGLDSFQALSVMETLKELSLNDRIVVAVIHQPRSSIYHLFDLLLLLSEGRQMYFGRVENALDFFSGLGFYCPPHYNPTDFYLDILSINYKTPEVETFCRERIQRIYTEWKKSKSFRSPSIFYYESLELFSPILLDKNATSFIFQWATDFWMLFWRSRVEIYRNYGALLIQLLTVFFFAAIISLIYQNLGRQQVDIQNRQGLLYFILINQSFSPLIRVLTSFPIEKRMVSREVMNGSYTISSYYISRVLAEFPGQIVLSIVFSSIVYWSVGLSPHLVQYLIFIATIVLTTLDAMSLGFLISSLSPNFLIANSIGPPIFIVLLLYGGFYINVHSLPVGSRWVRYLSNIFWGYQALILNEFRGLRFTCENKNQSCTLNGSDVINRLGFNNFSIPICLVSLLALTVGFLVLGYFGLALTQEKYCRMLPVPDENDDYDDGDDDIDAAAAKDSTNQESKQSSLILV